MESIDCHTFAPNQMDTDISYSDFWHALILASLDFGMHRFWLGKNRSCEIFLPLTIFFCFARNSTQVQDETKVVTFTPPVHLAFLYGNILNCKVVDLIRVLQVLYKPYFYLIHMKQIYFVKICCAEKRNFSSSLDLNFVSMKMISSENIWMKIVELIGIYNFYIKLILIQVHMNNYDCLENVIRNYRRLN